MAKVRRRGGFSDRNNIKTENTTIQIDSFDERTRVQLQNMLSYMYSAVYKNDLDIGRDEIQDFFRFVLGEIYVERIDTRKWYVDDYIWKMINKTLRDAEYDDVLSLLEAIIQYWDNYLKNTRGGSYYDQYEKEYIRLSVFEYANLCFEREYIGYRFVDGKITCITDNYEMSAIEEAMDTAYDVVREHLEKANRLLADRHNPDYENSIKESISAVEAICEVILGTTGKGATLGKMLKKLEDRGVVIHSGLRSAFNALYGYTSDANGIRHAGSIGGSTSTFEEAKFMLVACCAFVNYLIAIDAD